MTPPWPQLVGAAAQRVERAAKFKQFLSAALPLGSKTRMEFFTPILSSAFFCVLFFAKGPHSGSFFADSFMIYSMAKQKNKRVASTSHILKILKRIIPQKVQGWEKQ